MPNKSKKKGDSDMPEPGTSVIDVQKFLKGMDYPASKDELMTMAKQNKANDDVLDALDMLPEMDYESPADVTSELGKVE
jgi:hypothetical protein